MSDDKFPNLVVTSVVEWDLIAMGEITLGKEFIPRLDDIFLPNSNVKDDNIPLQRRSKSSNDHHVLITSIQMCCYTGWKLLQKVKNIIIFKLVFV